MEKIISKRINCLSTKIKREISNLSSISSVEDLSGVNSFIIVFIYNNKDRNIYQKDIEKEFGITRSTASNIISLMEKKGYVRRVNVDDDQRLKKLELTNLAIDYCENFLKDLRKLNSDLEYGISEEELISFINTIDKIEKNLLRRKENDKNIDEKY